MLSVTASKELLRQMTSAPPAFLRPAPSATTSSAPLAQLLLLVPEA
jgi:hypothetical protein